MMMANGSIQRYIKKFLLLFFMIIIAYIATFMFVFNKDYYDVCKFLENNSQNSGLIRDNDIVLIINGNSKHIYNGFWFKRIYAKNREQFSYTLHISKQDSFFNSITNSKFTNYKFCFWTNSCRDINGSVITDCTVIYIERVFGRRIITFKTILFP